MTPHTDKEGARDDAASSPTTLEHELRATRTVLETAGTAIFCVRQSGELSYVNAAARQFGVVEGASWFDVRKGLQYDPLTRSEWLDEQGRLPVDRALEGLAFERRFVVVLEREGLRLELGVGLERAELDGEVVAVVVAQDLTEQRRREGFFSAILEVLADPVWFFGSREELVTSNAAALEMVGQLVADLGDLESRLGLSSWLDDKPLEPGELPTRVALSGRAAHAVPVRARLPTGEGRLLSLSAVQIAASGGLVVTCTDLTELDNSLRRSGEQKSELHRLRQGAKLAEAQRQAARRAVDAALPEIEELQKFYSERAHLESDDLRSARAASARLQARLEEVRRVLQ